MAPSTTPGLTLTLTLARTLILSPCPPHPALPIVTRVVCQVQEAQKVADTEIHAAMLACADVILDVLAAQRAVEAHNAARQPAPDNLTELRAKACLPTPHRARDLCVGLGCA